MEDLDGARARDEALKRRTGSASRNRFWAGLNRYLATEAEHEHKAAKKAQDESRQSQMGQGRGSGASQ